MGDHRSRGWTIRPASREEERVALALARSADGALLKVDSSGSWLDTKPPSISRGLRCRPSQRGEDDDRVENQVCRSAHR